MKIWILHDSKYGNGKKLAEQLRNTFSSNAEVKMGHISEISPEIIAQNLPDVLILGGAIRMFRGALASKKWLKNLSTLLQKSNQTISTGIIFLTHGLPTEKVQGYAKRFWKKMSRSPAILQTFPKWITARVSSPQGPFVKGEIDNALKIASEFNSWILNRITNHK
ncbi:hypothetical protein [Candidatus Harpocratesius sp.]